MSKYFIVLWKGQLDKKKVREQYSEFYQRYVQCAMWEPRNTRINSIKVVRYGFTHVVTLKLYQEGQEKIFYEKGQAK